REDWHPHASRVRVRFANNDRVDGDRAPACRNGASRLGVSVTDTHAPLRNGASNLERYTSHMRRILPVVLIFSAVLVLRAAQAPSRPTESTASAEAIRLN